MQCVTVFPYPDWDKAQTAGMAIVRHLTGVEKQDLACLVHCGYVVQGFALSVGLPHKAAFGKAKAALPKTPKQMAKVLEATFGSARPFATYSEEANAIPWTLIWMIVKALIEKWLKG